MRKAGRGKAQLNEGPTRTRSLKSTDSLPRECPTEDPPPPLVVTSAWTNQDPSNKATHSERLPKRDPHLQPAHLSGAGTNRAA